MNVKIADKIQFLAIFAKNNSMRRVVLLLLTLFVVSCQYEHTLVVNFEGFESDKVRVTTQSLRDYAADRRGDKMINRYSLHNNQLILDIDLQRPTVVRIYNNEQLGAPFCCAELLLDCDDKVVCTMRRVNDRIETKVKGSRLNADLAEFNNILSKECTGQEDHLRIIADFVTSHPKSQASPFVLLDFDYADYKYAKQLCDKLNESCFTGVCAPLKGVIAKRATMPTMSEARIGEKAPDFTAATATGEEFTLSEWRGKWVVLFFCDIGESFCSLGMSSMRRYYNLHRDRMEVVCIECEMSKRLWENSIKAWDLDWTSIYAEDKTLYYLYGVEDYPTKIIISPDGIVHQYYNTEGEEFYREIDRIMR